jgi:hypothetical protein
LSTQATFAFDSAVRRPRARAGDPETSHEAARSVKGLSKKQRFILRLLRAAPATDEEIWEHVSEWTFAAITPSGARTRRAELVAMNLVRDSGERRKTRSGRDAIVWEAV